MNLGRILGPHARGMCHWNALRNPIKQSCPRGVHVLSRYYQEYIINEKRVSNFPIRSVECVRKVTRLECKSINDLFHIRDSIRT